MHTTTPSETPKERCSGPCCLPRGIFDRPTFRANPLMARAVLDLRRAYADLYAMPLDRFEALTAPAVVIGIRDGDFRHVTPGYIERLVQAHEIRTGHIPAPRPAVITPATLTKARPSAKAAAKPAAPKPAPRRSAVYVPPAEDILNANEAADIVGVPRETLLGWVRTRAISLSPYTGPGRGGPGYRFIRQEVERAARLSETLIETYYKRAKKTNRP